MIVGFAALAVADPLVPAHAERPAGAAAPRRRRAGCRIVARSRCVTNRNLLGVCLGFFCFDYYWYFLVNWLPDYLVTSRGLTIDDARASTRRCRTSCSA